MNSLEKQYNYEIFKSERKRSLILIGLLFLEAIFLLVIYLFHKEEYLKVFNSYIAIYAILIFTGIIIVYEFTVHYLLGKNVTYKFINPKLFGFLNSFSEITLLSILLIIILERSGNTSILQSPTALTYFVFIVLSTFRLNAKLSVFTGVIAALEFVSISYYYNETLLTTIPTKASALVGMQYLGKGMIMLITGIGAAFVAEAIKTNMQLSWKTAKEKMEVIHLFGQQISPQIAENLIKHKNELSGTRKKVCILFLDIRHFTEFVEDKQPEEVVAFLNKLFSFMIDIVQEHNGVINQFLGDGFMATFGAPVSIENSSQFAVDASQKIIQRLIDEENKGNIPKIKIGIGLHYDEAVTGNIGSNLRKQFSITGKVVIMASRIEQLNKKYNTSFLISKEVYSQLAQNTQENFEWLDDTTVKGSEKMVSLYKYTK